MKQLDNRDQHHDTCQLANTVGTSTCEPRAHDNYVAAEAAVYPLDKPYVGLDPDGALRTYVRCLEVFDTEYCGLEGSQAGYVHEHIADRPIRALRITFEVQGLLRSVEDREPTHLVHLVYWDADSSERLHHLPVYYTTVDELTPRTEEVVQYEA